MEKLLMTAIRNTALLALACLLALTAKAQRYKPLYEVEHLPPAINSTGEESKPIMIGDSLFFARSFHEDNAAVFDQDIWVTYRNADGNWVPASNEIEHVNDEFNNVILGASPDGNTYYLLNSYKLKVIPRLAISYVEKDRRGLSRPRDLKIKDYRPTDQFYDAYVDGGSGVILVSMNYGDSYGEEDLYVLQRDEKGRYSRLRNLGPVVNSAGFEIAPYLTPDRQRLYFASNGHGGLGDADIFFVDRLDSSWTNWSEPINLGEPVNSQGFDAYYYETDSGHAFFSSLRNQQDFADLYQARLLGTELIPGTEPVVAPEPVVDTTVVLADASEATQNNAVAGGNAGGSTAASGAPGNTATEQTAGNTSNTGANPTNNTTVASAQNTPGNPGTGTGQAVAQTETTETNADTGSGTSPTGEGRADTPTTAGTTPTGTVAQNESTTNNANIATADAHTPSEGPVTKPLTLGAEYLPPDRTVYFSLNSAELDLNGEVVLDMLVSEWKRQPELVLFIEGHTDDAGDKRYNLDLANRRAMVIRNYLLSQGLEDQNFVIMAIGEANPAVHNSDARNRRAELYFQRGFRRR